MGRSQQFYLCVTDMGNGNASGMGNDNVSGMVNDNASGMGNGNASGMGNGNGSGMGNGNASSMGNGKWLPMSTVWGMWYMDANASGMWNVVHGWQCQ